LLTVESQSRLAGSGVDVPRRRGAQRGRVVWNTWYLLHVYC